MIRMNSWKSSIWPSMLKPKPVSDIVIKTEIRKNPASLEFEG